MVVPQWREVKFVYLPAPSRPNSQFLFAVIIAGTNAPFHCPILTPGVIEWLINGNSTGDLHSKVDENSQQRSLHIPNASTEFNNAILQCRVNGRVSERTLIIVEGSFVLR